MTNAWAELAAICERARHDDDPAGATMSELRTLATPTVILDLIRRASKLDEVRRELLQARADSQIDGRAMRMLLGLPEDADAQAIVDALMGVVSQAALWRAIGTADHVTFVETHHDEATLLPGSNRDEHDPRDLKMIHVLVAGSALCGQGAPMDWPRGHWWVRVARKDEATCEACKAVLAQR